MSLLGYLALGALAVAVIFGLSNRRAGRRAPPVSSPPAVAAVALPAGRAASDPCVLVHPRGLELGGNPAYDPGSAAVQLSGARSGRPEPSCSVSAPSLYRAERR